MQTKTFKIWVAVGADGQGVVLGSGISRDAAHENAMIHFTDEDVFQIYQLTAEVPIPEVISTTTDSELVDITHEFECKTRGGFRVVNVRKSQVEFTDGSTIQAVIEVDGVLTTIPIFEEGKSYRDLLTISPQDLIPRKQ